MEINWITVAVYAGLAVLLLGPALGTYLPIRNAQTPAARRFLVHVSVAMWVWYLAVGVAPVLLAYHGVLPAEAGSAGLLVLAPLFAIPWVNRRVKELEAGAPPLRAG
jgi:hypothetical protein